MSVSPPIELVGWAVDLLKLGGWRTSTENLVAVVAWARQEGGHNHNNAAWNPLNTTQPMPGAGNTGSQGNIKVYVSRRQGLEATVKTLTNGRYGAVIAALEAGRSAKAVTDAVEASPWGTHNIAHLLGDARAQVARSEAGQLATSADPTVNPTPADPPSTTAVTSAGGPLAGPAPDPVEQLPGVPRTGLDALQLNGTDLWAYLDNAITGARLSATTDETTLLELTLEDPGHILLASGLFDDVPILTFGDLGLDLATLELTAGDAGRGGLTVGFSSSGVNVLRKLKGPVLAAHTSPSELVAIMGRQVGLSLVLEQTPQRDAIYVLGYRPDPPKVLDPVTGELVDDTTAKAGQDAETYWDAIARFAKEEGTLAFECAEVLYFGRPSWLVRQLPVTAVRYDPGGDNGTPGLLNAGGRRTLDGNTGAVESVEVTLELDSSLLGDARAWLPGCAVDVAGLPKFEGVYMVTALEADLVANTANVTLALPVDPVPEGPPEIPDDGTAATADGKDDKPGAVATAAGHAKPTGHPKPNPRGWVDPLAGKGKAKPYNYGEQGHTGTDGHPHRHEGEDYSVAVGTPVYAARAGKVTVASGGHGGYGNLVTIDHGQIEHGVAAAIPGHDAEYQTRYAHLSRISVNPGVEVRAGQLIGYSGGARGAPGSGNSKGPHLHFEVRRNGAPTNPIDYYPGRP